jgi:hypothetical protein
MSMEYIALQPSITITAAQIALGTGGTTLDNVVEKNLKNRSFFRLVATLYVTLCDRGNANETYNFYVTTFHRLASGVYSRWDVLAFPQIAAVGPICHTMIVQAMQRPASTTTADPGVEAVLSGSFNTTAAGAAHGIRTITAGMAYHGVMGEGLSYSLVGGGTTPGPITFEIGVTLIY